MVYPSYVLTLQSRSHVSSATMPICAKCPRLRNIIILRPIHCFMCIKVVAVVVAAVAVAVAVVAATVVVLVVVM